MKVSGNDGISTVVTGSVGYTNSPQNAASKDVKKGNR